MELFKELEYRQASRSQPVARLSILRKGDDDCRNEGNIYAT